MLDLRMALGAAATPCPLVNIGDAFATAANAAAAIANTSFSPAYSPYANDLSFWLGSYIFEDVGVSAYQGKHQITLLFLCHYDRLSAMPSACLRVTFTGSGWKPLGSVLTSLAPCKVASTRSLKLCIQPGPCQMHLIHWDWAANCVKSRVSCQIDWRQHHRLCLSVLDSADFWHLLCKAWCWCSHKPQPHAILLLLLF